MQTLKEILAAAPRAVPLTAPRFAPVLRHRNANPIMERAFHRALLGRGVRTRQFGDGFQYRLPNHVAWMDLETAVIETACRVA